MLLHPVEEMFDDYDYDDDDDDNVEFADGRMEKRMERGGGSWNFRP